MFLMSPSPQTLILHRLGLETGTYCGACQRMSPPLSYPLDSRLMVTCLIIEYNKGGLNLKKAW